MPDMLPRAEKILCSFNPCFSGSYVMPIKKYKHSIIANRVSIPVLVDLTLCLWRLLVKI